MLLRSKHWLNSLIVICILALMSGGGAYAYTGFLTDGYSDEYLLYNEGPGAERVYDNKRVGGDIYVYEKPTMKALAYTYWALGFYKLENEDAIDGFTRLNECEIFTNYHTDELEWKKIRTATRAFIGDNKTDFPTRFEFMMPIKMREYDSERRAYEVDKAHIIDSLRRFEFYADDAFSEVCNYPTNLGYPGALIIEFSRPFSLTHVPMSEDEADKYTRYIYQKFITTFDAENRRKAYLNEMYLMYLVFKVKFFTYGKYFGINHRLVPQIQMMAVMEGYEIYKDPAKEDLIFSQSFIANRKTGKLTVKLKDQYKILKEKSEKGGVLN